VHFEPVDLRNIVALRAADRVRPALGPVGVLVNNAGQDERHATEEVTPDYFDDRIATNLKHQFGAGGAARHEGGRRRRDHLHGLDLLDRRLRRHGDLHRVEVGGARPRALAGARLRADNVRVNSVAPGWIMTERQLTMWLTPEADAMRAERQCLKRRLMPEDVARVVLFLASEDASAITGQSYVVDGGWV
jgi:NAD(P)-dependent dehydrogenase (short-subunit alcohol dehydrogenase family)